MCLSISVLWVTKVLALMMGIIVLYESICTVIYTTDKFTWLQFGLQCLP